MKRAVIYCRKSTDRSDMQQQSLDAQLDHCNEKISKLGFKLVDTFIESRSWSKGWRIEFNKMIDLVNMWWIDCIVAYHFDRLSRNPRDTAELQCALQDWLLETILAWDSVFTVRESWTMMWVYGGQATDFTQRLKIWVKTWMLQKANKWGAIWKAPTWYKNNRLTKEYDIDSEKKEMVQLVFNLRADWLSYSDVAKQIFKKWYKNTNWQIYAPTTLAKIVANKFYIWVLSFWWKYTWKIDSEWIHETIIAK